MVKPIVNASNRIEIDGVADAISAVGELPSPRIFMPMTPFRAVFISRSTSITVEGSASITTPAGLTRAKSTSTHGV